MSRPDVREVPDAVRATHGEGSRYLLRSLRMKMP